MKCTTCDGEGTVEVFIGARCPQPASRCCGGCTVEVDCKRCHGTGEVDDKVDEEVDK